MNEIRGIYINPALRVVQVDEVECDNDTFADEIGGIKLAYKPIALYGYFFTIIYDHNARNDIGAAVRDSTGKPIVNGVAFITGRMEVGGIRSLTSEELDVLIKHIVRTKRNLYLLV